MEEFKHLTPAKLGYCLKGYQLKQKMKDRDMWLWFGNYGISSILTSLDKVFNGHKAKIKYIENPVLQDVEETVNGYKESNEEVAIYEMQQRINALRKSGLPESPA